MSKSKFNYQTGDGISWAKWSWNPATGCLGPDGKGPCNYCYARDRANRYNINTHDNFEPTFHPDRLNAPKNTKIPKGRENEPGIRNVFTVSMGDLFGYFIPPDWIGQIFQVIYENPQWNFILLTKNPKRYLYLNFPPNCWIGATADTQERALIAVDVFKELNTKNIKFISFEPLSEEINFRMNDGNCFDWMIIGGQSRSTGQPAMQPEWKWVENLLMEARHWEIPIYFKPNLTIRPKEFPNSL